jgi:uncharacterized membrane-anchored protein
MAAQEELVSVVTGVARVDRRTKDLVKRLRAGEIAVIDHEDLDRVAAEGLIEARPAAVVNAAASISGRYPNFGPLLIAAAGIPLLDNVGPALMDEVRDGDQIVVEGTQLLAPGPWTGQGTRQDIASLEATIETAKSTMGAELERFAENTLEYMRRERHLIIDEPVVPDVRVDMRGRHALIVVRGFDYRDDLAALRQGGYLQEMSPVLIGVDGGADALFEMGGSPTSSSATSTRSPSAPYGAGPS